MKINKATIIYIINILIVIASLIVSIVLGNVWYFVLVSVVFILVNFVGRRLEINRLIKNIKESIESKCYIDAINYLKANANKNIFFLTNYACLINLVIVYMFNDQEDEAKKVLAENPKLKRAPDLMYVRFILAIVEEDRNNIRYYAAQVLNLRHKRYQNQQDNVSKILKMLETNTVNNEIYENTSYPTLKKLCKRIEEKSINTDIIKCEITPTIMVDIKKSTGVKRSIKIILNVLTCLTLLFALIVIGVTIIHKVEPITSFEGMYYLFKIIWVFYLFLPITVGNIIYSIYLKKQNYKYKSNLILGIIFTILLFLYGSIYFTSSDSYSTDKTYLYNLEEQIGISLANDFTIVTDDWTKGVRTSSDNTLLKYESVVRIKGESNINFDNDLWNDDISQIEMLPTLFVFETTSYDKYLIYCFDTSEFSPNQFISKYNYVAIAYSYENNNLLIYEFCIK